MSIDEAIKRIEEDLAVLKRARDVLSRIDGQSEGPQNPISGAEFIQTMQALDPVIDEGALAEVMARCELPEKPVAVDQSTRPHPRPPAELADALQDAIVLAPTRARARARAARLPAPGDAVEPEPPVADMAARRADIAVVNLVPARERDRCHVTLLDPDDLLSQPVAAEAQT